jgi:hypothetical protein
MEAIEEGIAMIAQLLIGFVADVILGSLVPRGARYEAEMDRYLRQRGFVRGSASSTSAR